MDQNTPNDSAIIDNLIELGKAYDNNPRANEAIQKLIEVYNTLFPREEVLVAQESVSTQPYRANNSTRKKNSTGKRVIKMVGKAASTIRKAVSGAGEGAAHVVGAMARVASG